MGSFTLSIFFTRFSFLFCYFSSKLAAQPQSKHNNNSKAFDERRHHKTCKKYAIVNERANALQCCLFHKTKRFGACRMYQVAQIGISYTHITCTQYLCYPVMSRSTASRVERARHIFQIPGTVCVCWIIN